MPLTVKKLLNLKDCNKEFNRLKRLIKKRDDWHSSRESKAKKETAANKKAFDQRRKARAEEAEANERVRLAEAAREAAEAVIASTSAAAEGTTAETPAATETVTETSVTETSETVTPGTGETPIEIGDESPAEEDFVDEVVIQRKSRSRARPTSSTSATGLTSPIRRRRGGGSTDDTSDDRTRRLGAIVNDVGKISRFLESFETTMQNRHNVSWDKTWNLFIIMNKFHVLSL